MTSKYIQREFITCSGILLYQYDLHGLLINNLNKPRRGHGGDSTLGRGLNLAVGKKTATTTKPRCRILWQT